MIQMFSLSDQHGFLPEVPKYDLLLLGGDYTNKNREDYIGQARFLDGPFYQWLDKIRNKGTQIVGVWGNHEVVADKAPYFLSDEILGRGPNAPWVLLQNSSAQVLGLNLWGTPYSRTFGTGWGFNADEERLDLMYATIPKDTNVIISHGPPHGYGDQVMSGERVGNQKFTEMIKEIQPSQVVTGHIHFSAGVYLCGKTYIINAAYVGENYLPRSE